MSVAQAICTTHTARILDKFASLSKIEKIQKNKEKEKKKGSPNTYIHAMLITEATLLVHVTSSAIRKTVGLPLK